MNLQFWLFRIRDTIFNAPGSFSDEKYAVYCEKHLILFDIANLVVIYSTRPYEQNIASFKTCIIQKTFQDFMLKCVNWLSKTCFVKVKINYYIILSEIPFDNGEVERWVAYFFN